MWWDVRRLFFLLLARTVCQAFLFVEDAGYAGFKIQVQHLGL
jgi:hypothetical protein